MLKRILTLFVAVIAIIAITGTARATTIDTAATWDGAEYINAFGEPDTATYGQTFNLSAGSDTSLDSVTFYVDDFSNPDSIDFAFYLYEWDGTKITGASLFESAPMATSNAVGFETFTVNTGGVTLLTGTDYVFFLSASNFFDGEPGNGKMGFLTSDPYSGGTFVYMNNGNDFGLLSTTPWSIRLTQDLAFTMELSAVPEPSTLLLLGSGLIGLGFVRRRFKR